MAYKTASERLYDGGLGMKDDNEWVEILGVFCGIAAGIVISLLILL